MTDARSITLAAGGRWYGSYGKVPCPVCQPERRPDQAALVLSDGRIGLLVDCKKTGCAFRDIAAALGLRRGGFTLPDAATLAQREADRLAKSERRSTQARQIWTDAIPIAGTIAETYLCRRGITCALPDTLRFHPDCWHKAAACRWPALIAVVEGTSAFAVHRTYLRPDGTGKAPIEPCKAMLGPTSGGAVRLSHSSERIVVAEGIETGLSLLCGLLAGPATVWAALSACGMRTMYLPDQPAHLTIARDGDPAGRASALALAERAHNAGWRVDFLDPGDGRDFNDYLREGLAQ